MSPMEITNKWQNSDHSDMKITLEFVDEIQVMIDNGPNKSIRSIVNDIEVYEFLIRQVVHEDKRRKS